MTPRELYLAWVRTSAPQAYVAALRKVTGKRAGLGGLGSDLVSAAIAPDLNMTVGDARVPSDVVQAVIMRAPRGPQWFAGLGDDSGLVDISFDPESVDVPAVDTGSSSVFDFSTPVDLPGDVVTPATASNSTSNMFSSFLNAVTNVATTVVGAQSQANLLTLNTQRAAQGLPPVNANGMPVTATGLASTNPTILAMERSLAASGGTNIGMIAAVGLGALLLAMLLKRKGRR